MDDLFDVDSWEYGKNKKYQTILKDITSKSISVISGLTENNGVNYHTEDELAENEIFEAELTISTRGEYSGSVFYHPERFALANNILVMKMPSLTKNQKLFIGGLINSLPYGGYSGYPRKETLKKDKIQLPTKNNKIDFNFMKSFIAEIEAERIAELDKYLSANGFKDTILTEKEQEVLANFDDIKFMPFNVIDVFNVKNSRNILSSDIVENSGETPYLCASSENNAVSSYISYDTKYLDKGNCIFIGGKTFVVSYQANDFYSNDSHNLVLHLKNEENRSKSNQLYLATCINKSLGHQYSWGDSISNKKIQKDIVSLPVNNDKIDFTLMETLISAIQKLVVKDMVQYVINKSI